MEALITFGYNALAGVAGNIIYKLLNDSLEKKEVDELVKYKNSEDFEGFKKEMESILKYNKQLKTELEKLEEKSGDTIEIKDVKDSKFIGKNENQQGDIVFGAKTINQNSVNGNSYYSEGNMNINQTEKPIPKP